MTYEPIWLYIWTFWDNHLLGEGETWPCQTPHNEAVKKLMKHYKLELSLFQKPWLKTMISVSNIAFRSGNFPLLQRHSGQIFSNFLNFQLNKLIDWVVDPGQRVLIWTVRVRMASTVVGDKLVSPQKPQQVACVWAVHSLSFKLPPFTHVIN